MLSPILRSPRAVAVNIEIMRAFVALRGLALVGCSRSWVARPATFLQVTCPCELMPGPGVVGERVRDQGIRLTRTLV
jgi:hypothetical protein